MISGLVIFLIAVAIVGILMLVRFKKLKHEIFAVFLIALMLFGVFSFTMAFRGKDITIENLADVEKVAKIYFSWLGTAMNNVKTITAQAVKMNWKGNRTA